MLNFDKEDLLICPICCNEYNELKNKPICISCGHTICQECLYKLNTNNSIMCPIDKKKINFTNPNTNQSINKDIINIIQLSEKFYLDCKRLT